MDIYWTMLRCLNTDHCVTFGSENKKKDKLEREMKELRFSMDAKQNDVKAKQAQVLENQEQVDKLDMQLKEQKGVTDKAQKELDLVLQKVCHLQRLIDFLMYCKPGLSISSNWKGY